MKQVSPDALSLQPLADETRAVLHRAARQFGTPSYVYFLDAIRDRFDAVRNAFDGRFEISFAVKANPNAELMRRFSDKIATFDCSAIAEVERALAIGYPASRLTFSGPAKRVAELRRAVEVGVGEMVCESESELADLDRLAGAAGRVMPVFLRINPSRAPKYFGVNMAGKPSQFGIDEEQAPDVIGRLGQWKNLQLEGFHIYSGTNCLDAAAIAENFAIFIDIFGRLSDTAGIQPRKLIFGSGFGVPYHLDEQPLEIGEVARKVNPLIDAMRENPALAEAQCILEMGRFLIGPEGYLVTSVIREKTSRGAEIRLCDAGFNNHLAACGMMGTVIRRNWPMWKVSGAAEEPTREYQLTGPLCTTIDQIAARITMPPIGKADVLAIGSSGAYGLTASPTGFISHPEPREVLVVGAGDGAELIEITDGFQRDHVLPVDDTES